MKVYLLLAEGFETIEALSPVDVLRRGGVDVVTVSITAQRWVTSSQGVRVEADTLLSQASLDDGDALVLPGGYPGYENLGNHPLVLQQVQRYALEGRLLGAICGAPTVLLKAGVGRGKRITAHSSVASQFTDYAYTGQPVVQDGQLITSIGAGHSVAFGLALLARLTDESTVAHVKQGMELVP